MASTSEPAPRRRAQPGPGLRDHGDTQVPPGHLDLAVNVHPDPPPGLAQVLAGLDVTAYPDPARARDLLAARHGVTAEEVLLINGAAEAFWALAHALAPGTRAGLVHPSFTAPEAALRSAGHEVRQVLRRAEDDFVLDPDQVGEDLDVVVLGRPDNPTGRSEDVAQLRRLLRPGRLLVVDEAFAEHTGDGLGLSAERAALPGLVQVRSLTKVWGAAGLRMGYVVADAPVVRALAATLQPWPVNAVALAVLERLFAVEHRDAVEVERRRRGAVVATARTRLVAALRDRGLQVWAGEANFVLVRAPGTDLRTELLAQGVAVRRADTFPGLDRSFVRVAVHPDPTVTDRFLIALDALERPGPADRAARPR
ncbi:aminotransferase class I/II-fold pyridoxal phosphate-dependent enzyme [Jannaschia sp. R86511]|uniref:aminotransferase class I/II-fold pyridoxal phosphate-dependent enzyme n=1 Tax=Jannaschia sp. R86511 TaxID=3093853 RepID=UPI0036D3207A